VTSDATALVEVRIIGLPLGLWAATQEHIDGLLREFTLLIAGRQQGLGHHEPRQLLDVVAEIQADYEGTTAQQQQLVDAFESGAETIDLTELVPTTTAIACTRLGEALDAADRYCRQGDHLLSLATPLEALAFRRWYLGEFIAQINGEPPRLVAAMGLRALRPVLSTLILSSYPNRQPLEAPQRPPMPL
jgi:hypothetical protein